MTGDMRAFRAAEQLSAILATAALPRSARALAERVEARLSAPVRIAVLGAPGTGKRRIVEGVLGGAVLPGIEGLPPAEITLGAGDRIEVVTGEGARESVDVADFATLDPADLALIRLSAPLPLLEKIRFLVVPLEGETADLRAALAWTFRRADMVLWCASRLDGPDRALWAQMPEALRDHAFLAVTRPAQVRPSEADRMHAANYFSETRDLSPGAEGPDRIARLRTRLLSHVSRARREDLEGALIFLDHHLSREARARGAAVTSPGPAPGAAPASGVPSAAGATWASAPPPDAPPDAAPDRPADPPADAAGLQELPERGDGRRPALVEPAPRDAGNAGDAGAAPSDGPGQIPRLLAIGAARLQDLCAPGAAAPPEQALHLCADLLEEAGEIARAGGGAQADVIDEAADLMLLLQLEGSEGALSDAVALLLQVRRECEGARAA